MSADLLYYIQTGELFTLGRIVDGVRYPLMTNVSRRAFKETLQQLLEAGIDLDPECAINCKRRK